MQTPGLRNIFLGLLVCVVGIAVTAATYSVARGGGAYVAAWGAVLLGAILAGVGLVQILKHKMRSPVDRVLPDAQVELKALLCATIHAAETDGPLDERKIAALQSVLQELTGRPYNPFLLRDVGRAMARDRVSALDFLQGVQRELPPQAKELILRASALVARDGKDRARAQQTLRELCRALGLTDAQCHEAAAALNLPPGAQPA